MNTATASLENLFSERLPAGGFKASGGRDLYMEVKDTTTGLVWMTSAPVAVEDFETLQLDETLVKVGIARARMDRAAFWYSPGAPDEPVHFVEVVGDTAEDDSLVLPEGCSLKQIELVKPWLVSLPTPTRTFFWFGKSIRSFQGPVTLPDDR